MAFRAVNTRDLPHDDVQHVSTTACTGPTYGLEGRVLTVGTDHWSGVSVSPKPLKMPFDTSQSVAAGVPRARIRR